MDENGEKKPDSFSKFLAVRVTAPPIVFDDTPSSLSHPPHLHPCARCCFLGAVVPNLSSFTLPSLLVQMLDWLRAGNLSDAEALIEAMPVNRDCVIWEALLGARLSEKVSDEVQVMCQIQILCSIMWKKNKNKNELLYHSEKLAVAYAILTRPLAMSPSTD
ncbi:pentatricopeptide repeat-containing protein [Cucumis melo var. makuwa]|uniref:Pentatricopeptide repeat-containing protein n=1 Tax=Cucumis melo var. makuwa TaxID=1194695 RepID=A0A5A7US97_CUCMM|nr:pentatricopeptide repeat-containing protein [Cucumis melo var. makuwa]